LELGVGRCGGFESVIVYYALSINPMFIRFDGKDQLLFPLEQVDDRQVATWVDERLLRFLDTYVQLENDDHYQKENQVTDPVCGMTINRFHAAAKTDHEGQTYYFCVPDCHTKFVADPAKYVGS
jgi:YHS domain-containing protein